MNRILYLFLIILLTECYAQKNAKGKYYAYKIPKFTEDQNKLIKKIYPIIINDLDEPGNYYIAKIEKTNKGVKAIVPNLQILQDGINYETGLAKFTVDFSIYVYLFKDDLINYNRTEAVDSDLEEIENDQK